MKANEFREAVWSGLGRAILYARDHDVHCFREVILDACLHCRGVDPQCEGTRAAYMLQLLDPLPDRESYCNAVLDALAGAGDDWDGLQRFWFALSLALDGNSRAKQAMYDGFKPGARHGEEIGCAFIELDGLDGFLFAAAKMGELILSGARDVDVGYLLWRATDTFGEKQTSEALADAGKLDPRVEAYRGRAEACRTELACGRGERERIKATAYRELAPKLPETRPYWIGRWGEHASAADLKSAAQDLLNAREPEQTIALLRVFSRRAFPLDHSRLIAMAESGEQAIAIAAAIALSHIGDRAVRNLAFRLVETGAPARREAIAILSRNWQPGDHEVALAWFEAEPDRLVRHSLEIDLRKMWKQHPEPESEIRMLLSIYEKGPCSECRGFIVESLIGSGAMSEAMRREFAHDANEDTRNLVGAE